VDRVIHPVVALMEPAFHAKGVALTIEDAGTLPFVWADAEKIHQVLVNLLTNALAATPPDGTVVVAGGTRPAMAEELEIGRRAADAMTTMVTITVRDTGCGMPPEDVQKAFQPFFTTKALGTGTGLGLFLSREIVVAHGGQLSLESDIGKGTAVTISLPGLIADSVPVA
jgi:signal transduction histidine kinase